jgi:glutaredoxin 3
VSGGVRLYTTRFCPFCIRARQLLEMKGVRYEETAVDSRPDLRAQMHAESGRHTVPQIWIGDRHVGGFDDLWRLEQRGELDPMLGTA